MSSKPFASTLPAADARNQAGGLAYVLSPRHALAQLAATGCLSNTYYANADNQMDTLVGLIDAVDDALYLAKLAVYSRERAFMKDMPAALVLALAKRDVGLFKSVFPRVIDNGRMLRTFFQLLRSGRFGKKSLSYALQKAVQRWLNGASVGLLLSASIGNDPSLRDVLRLARPTPPDNARRALFGWLTGKPAEGWAPATEKDLPEEVKALESFRKAASEEEQVALLERHRYRWDLLADAVRGPSVWKALARHMGAQAVRMNLNTLHRHGVFEDQQMIDYVAARLSDGEEIRRARQFPYQYLAAYLNADPELPEGVRGALETAAELACGNVPGLPGPVLVGLDVSASMRWAITGSRGRGTPTKVRCVHVAALFAAAVLRRNPGSVIVPFDTRAYEVEVRPEERIVALAARLARYGGGGTDCSVPLAHAVRVLCTQRFAGCVLVSDNESWVGTGRYGSTGVMTEWSRFASNQARLADKAANGPKLVCIDLQPGTTTQAPDRSDILNVGGFSDAVFEVVAGFLRDDSAAFVKEVESVTL